jgi:hypothetical protein
MLIIPLFAAANARNATVRYASYEGFNTGYNNIYDKNGNIIETDVLQYDIISAIYLIMRGYNANYYYRWGVMDNIVIVLLYILTFIISVYAAYLSFICTWKGLVDNIIIRLLFAFVAFMFGPFYLIWYVLVNYLGKLC